MCADLKGVDLAALERQTARLRAATTASATASASSRSCSAQTRLRLRRGCGARTCRSSSARRSGTRLFPDGAADGGVRAHARRARHRPRRAGERAPRHRAAPAARARARSARPVRVPDEVYLVIPRAGGRDDFAALFHEGGHTEHYAQRRPPTLPVRVPPPRRQLGDRVLRVPVRAPGRGPDTGCAPCSGAEDADAYLGYARATKLVFLRRYAAKLAYELRAARRRAVHWPRCRTLYAQLLGEAVGSTGRG